MEEEKLVETEKDPKGVFDADHIKF